MALGLRGRLVASHVLFMVLLVGVAAVGAKGAHSASVAGGDATSTAAATVRDLAIVVAIAGLLVAASAWWLSHLVTTPLRELRSLFDAGSSGDLARRGSGDGAEEFGDLMRRYNAMATALTTTISTVSTNATGLVAAAEELTVSAGEISAGAEESAERSGVVAAAAEQVSSNVRTVAAATAEMSASINEIARNTSTAAEIAANAVGAVSVANSTIERLGSSSTEIGNVVKVITSIAEQTNLLALNATIEAARAGDAGKGFAVVAGEVKELARETALATEDVGRRIEEIQADFEAAETAIATISGIIDRINETQTTIASAIEEQTATTGEISRSITEAAQGADEIAESISGVARAAATASEGVGATLVLSQDLSAMSGELVETAGRFALPPQSETGTVSIRDQITRAISAHGAWKRRLTAALASRSHAEDVSTVARSDVCAFGRWLQDTSPSTADAAVHRTSGILHAQFHRQAADVLQLITTGDLARAKSSLEPGGGFAEASRQLTKTMIEWRRSA